MSDPAAFIDAIKAGDFDRVKAMLSADPRLVGARSAKGESAILTAVYRGHKEIVNLLAHGANVAATSTNSNGNTPLHAALAGNHSFVAGLLLGAGSDVNAADAAGWRPLHLAAANNSLDTMKTLIAQGADVHAANAQGQTPLALAQEKNLREAAALLRRHGG